MERVRFEPGSSSVPSDELEYAIAKLNSIMYERSKKHIRNKAKMNWVDIEVLKRLLTKENATPKGEETLSASTTAETEGGNQPVFPWTSEETTSPIRPTTAKTKRDKLVIRRSVNGEPSDNPSPVDRSHIENSEAVQ